MTLEEFNKLGETDPSIDRELDEYQKELGEREDNIIVEGRTSHYFIPKSFSIFIKVSNDEGAKRIWNDILKNPDKRNEGDLNGIEDVKKSMENRMESDKKRYLKYYGKTLFEEDEFDLIVDSTDKTPDEVFEIVMQEYEKRK